MGIIYIGILFCSIAFAIVVVYICFVLKRISNTLGTLGKTMGELEKEVQYITPKLIQTMRETNGLIDDVDVKLKATDSAFDSIENAGVSLQALNQAYANNAQQLTDEQFQKKTKPFVEGIKWSEAALYLYSKWKKGNATYHNKPDINQTGKEG